MFNPAIGQIIHGQGTGVRAKQKQASAPLASFWVFLVISLGLDQRPSGKQYKITWKNYREGRSRDHKCNSSIAKIMLCNLC